ncbi:endonuclease [Wenjunlia vitaminophila]|uniref:Endonuclease n=1 Tax=Wenjunlia vitaminophila TaxID=76728 RepID=A0A0T6LVD1_WENVI|nr:endonuclease/exonuclease/phosphatase family protein [Wenjunlia vitaminophila]KRV50099.1 endonuclease [Wenjunlia vitaminophila]
MTSPTPGNDPADSAARNGRAEPGEPADTQALGRGLPASASESDGSVVVRLLSYNVRSLRDDRAALVRVVRACAPDVVCVQEAPRFFRWRKKAAWLARDCGLVAVTGGQPAAGPLLLSSLRARVVHSEDVLLPRTPGLHRRGFATATLEFGSVRLGVVSCHLSLDRAERQRQADALLRRVDGTGERYAVAAGDINEAPEGSSWQLLTGKLRDAHATVPWGGTFTSPAGEPLRRIDGVFVTPEVEVLGCGVPQPEDLPGLDPADLAAASDHLPVLAALRLRG